MNYPPLQWPEICDWGKEKGGQKNCKDLHGVRIRKKMVSERRRNGKIS